MFAKRILTQSVVYWTFLLAVLTTLTAFSLTQGAPESSSLIALDPSEMATIVGGGSCYECVSDNRKIECEGNIYCAPSVECGEDFGLCLAAGANPMNDHVYCYFPQWTCSGDPIPGAAPKCHQTNDGVSVRIYNCDCINGKCTTRTSIIAGYRCTQNGPGHCPHN